MQARKSSPSRYIFLSGLIIWVLVQSLLVSFPLWTRDLPPEVDDSMAYLARTRGMAECFLHDCPAIQDLQSQFSVPSSDPDVQRQRNNATFPFPFYHPLFSLILLGISRFGLGLETAYKVLWSLGPLFFGLAFAALLKSLWGRAAAGITLALLAFKVFPDTGLHYLVPSNLAMGLAALVWSRIIARRGDAPLVLLTGALMLPAVHPIGGLCMIMASALAFFMPRQTGRLRVRLYALSVPVLLLIAFFALSAIRHVPITDIMGNFGSAPTLRGIIHGFFTNVEMMFVETVRMRDPLLGSLPVFCFALTLGFIAVSPERRLLIRTTVAIYAAFLLCSLFHTHVGMTGGDLFLRFWIPFFVIVFGAIGYALFYAFSEGLPLLKAFITGPGGTDNLRFQAIGIAAILALLTGYSLEMTFSGCEQVYATAQYMRERQDLRFDTGQPETLLARAHTGDRVLYTSVMAMSFYFTHGAYRLGAVYYHPAFQESGVISEWLARPDLRFAVTYNPTVYHPQLASLDEKDRCITSPEFRFSPLSKPRTFSPLSREGYIAASDFTSIDILFRSATACRLLSLDVANPGQATAVEVVPCDTGGSPIPALKKHIHVPQNWTGRLETTFDSAAQFNRFQLVMPSNDSDLSIGGISFDTGKLHWPWAQKADMVLHAKNPWTGKVVLSFDPSRLVSPPLDRMSVNVLDDTGSTVLLGIDR